MRGGRNWRRGRPNDESEEEAKEQDSNDGTGLVTILMTNDWVLTTGWGNGHRCNDKLLNTRTEYRVSFNVLLSALVVRASGAWQSTWMR